MYTFQRRIAADDFDELCKTTKFGTPLFLAPEVIEKDKNPVMYTEKIDVYSFGLTLFSLWEKKYPFVFLFYFSMLFTFIIAVVVAFYSLLLLFKGLKTI